jgi:hypothetical protein
MIIDSANRIAIPSVSRGMSLQEVVGTTDLEQPPLVSNLGPEISRIDLLATCGMLNDSANLAGSRRIFLPQDEAAATGSAYAR